MAKLYNLARMTTATTGTGTITLGSAVSGCLTFAQAGISDGETVSYAISDGANSEVGRGVYTSSGTTLTRSVIVSTNSNSAISLSGSAQVFIAALAEDIASGDLYAWTRLANDYTLTSQTAAQKIFNNSSNGAVSVETGLYQFECYFVLTGMSSSNGSFGFALGGTATFTQQWGSTTLKPTGGTLPLNTTQANVGQGYTAANTGISISNANTAAGARIYGIVNVTAAGTIIPQVSQGVASASVVKTDSYFTLRRLGAANGTTGGTWS